MINRLALNKALTKIEPLVAWVGKLVSTRSGDTLDPVFVIGTGRCGSTLFSRVLESHRDLLVYPTEANNLFFPNSYPYSRASIAVPPILESPSEYTALSVDAWPAEQGVKLQRVFRGFQRLNPAGQSMLIKSAMVSFLIPQLADIFPTARFIHLYRSGPSVVTSIIKKEWEKYSSLTTPDEFLIWAAQYWNACLIEIARAEQALGLRADGRFFELSYEDFCEAPQGLSAELADFLSIDPVGFGFDFNSIQSTNHKASALSDGDIARIEPLMAPAMSLKGYL